MIVALALTVLLAGCAGPGASAPRPGPASGTSNSDLARAPMRITVGVRGTPQVLYNKLNIGSAGLGVAEVERLVHAGLAGRDDRDVLQPLLAEAVPSLDNGLWTLLPDGEMETTWRIRQGARWHDGTPVTVDDLVFTAALAQDREIPVFRDRTFEAVQRLEALDARTLRVTWSRPYVLADTLFSFAGGGAQPNVTPLPRHLLEPAYLTDKPNFPQISYWTTEFVGAGPFRLKEYDRDSHMVLRANDGFVLGRPRVDEIEIRFIPDGNTIIANLLAGTLDLTFDSRSITFAQALQIQDQWRDGQVAYARATWVTMYPQFLNPTPPAVADVQFRRALIHSIDRQDIVDTMQAGVGGVAHHYIGPDWAEFREVDGSIVRYDHDPRRAAQLLEGLGFTRAGDGFYRGPSGQRFVVEIRTTGVDINSKSSFAVANYWQRAGVPSEVAIVPPQRTNEREYRSTFPGFELIRPGTNLTAFESYRSSETPTAETNWAGANRARYRNADFDALIDRYFITIPTAERMRVLGQLVHHSTDQLLNLGIVYDPPLRLISHRLRNVRAGTPWDSWQWDVVS